jgi:serine/threonine protein kinase/Tfp pilus assembly protein PilF
MAALAPGTKLGPYEIVAPIGVGGMGEVYRAQDSRLGRDVAIKVLPQELAGHPDRLARLAREARTVAALNHPNIVTLFALEEAGDSRFLVMELVEGRSLDQLVTPSGLPVPSALKLALALSDALTAAHERGVVHRDLKPSNVMVTREGRLKVLDFGLAKLPQTESVLAASQAATMESPISSAGQVLGTVPYMAPEQLRGEPADARTDLFALGVVMYELLTGRRPFEGATMADVSSAILRDAPASMLTLRADLPRELDSIVGRCLEKDRELRFQAARDVRHALDLVRRDLESGTSATSRVAAAPATRGPDTSAPAKAMPSIAVLPFVNRSRDQEDEYFADGLADELLNVLAKIRGLRVAARTSSSTFKGKSVTIADVGQTLGVASVLEGSVRKSGNRVRIAVQLVKVADGYQLWSETYDRTLDDIFAVQDDIAQAVVKELRSTLLGETPDTDASGEVKAEVAVAAAGRGGDPEAHRLYLQGRYLIDRLTNEDTARAMGYLREALERDPQHALAWATLSYAHFLTAGYGWGPVAEENERGREAALRAIAITPDLAEAHAMLGRIRTTYDWDWAGAAASYRRALELAPGNADVLIGAAVSAQHLGKDEEALRLCRLAVAQDPLGATGYGRLGTICRMMGLHGEAEAALRKSLELAPQRILSHLVLALTMMETGRPEEALVEIQREPADWARLTGLAIVHHAAGRAAESDRAMRELEEHHATDSAYQVAAAHAFRGERDATFAWLERAYDQRDGGTPFARSEPTFNGVKDDPRWAAFMKKMRYEG